MTQLQRVPPHCSPLFPVAVRPTARAVWHACQVSWPSEKRGWASRRRKVPGRIFAHRDRTPARSRAGPVFPVGCFLRWQLLNFDHLGGCMPTSEIPHCLCSACLTPSLCTTHFYSFRAYRNMTIFQVCHGATTSFSITA